MTSKKKRLARTNVLPFPWKTDQIMVSLPPSANPHNIETLTMCGDALAAIGIIDGDDIIVRTGFGEHDITPDTFCLVQVRDEELLVVRKIRREGRRLRLKSLTRGIADRVLSIDDVEVKGIAIAFQRSLLAQAA